MGEIHKELVKISNNHDKLLKIAKLQRAALDEIHSWAVCASITNDDDLMQNIGRIIEISDKKYLSSI